MNQTLNERYCKLVREVLDLDDVEEGKIDNIQDLLHDLWYAMSEEEQEDARIELSKRNNK